MTVVDISPPELPALRFHQLRRIGQSPAHYHAATEGPPRDKGTALHSVLLGGQRVTFYPKMTDGGKAAPRNGKDWEAFKADNPGALILTRAESEEVNGMAASVRACPEAMVALEGIKEQSLYWDNLGRRCRGTPDARTDVAITDLKSTRTSDPRRFMWEMLKYGYHAQLAWYLDGTALAGAGQPTEAYIVAVEAVAPYVVTVFKLTDRALDMGRRMYRTWLEKLAACEDIDAWPGYTQTVVPLDVPEGDLVDVDGEAEAA